MATYVLTTAGSSLLGNLRRQLPQAQPTVAEGRRFLQAREITDRDCGAELNSLAVLRGQSLSAGPVTDPLTIHLLASDTPEGRWTGEVLQGYLAAQSWVAAASYEVLEGLDGGQPDRFEREGLRALVKVAARCLRESRPHYDLQVINATGGYKAQISFAGLIGQALQVPVVYLYETFPRCIELPPMPVEFDRALWLEHYPLFARLAGQQLVPAAEVRYHEVDARLWALLDRLTDAGQEYVELSPILELMHQTFLMFPPRQAIRPADSPLLPQDKLHINRKELGHSPKRSLLAMERLARLPWVTRVENLRFLNTPERSRVKAHGNLTLDEIRCIYGDGDLGLEIKLLTTATTQAEREWCLEALREELAGW